VSVLFCLVDDAYLKRGPGRIVKRFLRLEVLTLALFQQLRGVGSQRYFLRDVTRFFSHLFPGAGAPPPPRCTAACASSPASYSP
jgi:hypothetical protein